MTSKEAYQNVSKSIMLNKKATLTVIKEALEKRNADSLLTYPNGNVIEYYCPDCNMLIKSAPIGTVLEDKPKYCEFCGKRLWWKEW